MRWRNVKDEMPELEEQYGGAYLESTEVLATNGRIIAVCYFCTYPDEDDPDHIWPGWKIAGRDGYDFNVTHWMPLPKMPGG